MEISPAAKVGMVTVLALIVLALIYTWVQPGRRVEGVNYYAVFDRIEGLSVGAPVRLAGVSIGKVTDISINDSKQIVVRFTVSYEQNGQPLTVSSTSVFGITGNLLGDKWLEITPRQGPPLSPEGQVVGMAPVTIDMMMAKGEETLAELETTVKDFNKLVGDPEFKRNIQETVANFNALSGDMRIAAQNVNSVIRNLNGRISTITEHVDDLVVGLRDDMEGIGGDFRALSGTMRRIASNSEPEITAIVSNLRAMSASLRQTTAAVQKVATNKQVQEDLLGTLTALRKTGEEVQGIASDIRGITSDPEIRADLEATIRDARETVAGAKVLIERINKAVGGFVGGGGGDDFKLFQLRTELEYATDTTKLYPNANLTLLPSFRYNGILGVDRIGTDNLVNFQVGLGPAGKNRFRAGVVRSKVGVGFDTMLFKRLNLSADLYDTHIVQLDLIGRMTLGKDFYVMGGVRDALHTRSPVVGVGKRF